jgi:hypothetical protein
MSNINRFQVFARFQYFGDNSIGIRQCPLCINKNGVGLPGHDYGGNFKTTFVAEKDFRG